MLKLLFFRSKCIIYYPITGVEWKHPIYFYRLATVTSVIYAHGTGIVWYEARANLEK